MNFSARLAADFIVVVHAAFVAFVLFGQILIVIGGICGWSWVRNRWFRGIHFASIGIVVLESWCGVTCPLTTWEHNLRLKAGEGTYDGAFIAYWAHELLFYDGEPWVFTTAYSVFGALVLASLWFIPPRWRATPAMAETTAASSPSSPAESATARGRDAPH